MRDRFDLTKEIDLRVLVKSLLRNLSLAELKELIYLIEGGLIKGEKE